MKNLLSLLVFPRKIWLGLFVILLLVTTAFLASYGVYHEEQQGVADEQSAANAQERCAAIERAVSMPHSNKSRAEKRQGQHKAYRIDPTRNGCASLVTAERSLSRSTFLMTAWGVEVTILIGLIALLIALNQFFGSPIVPRPLGVERDCVICDVVRRQKTGEAYVVLANVGRGPVSLSGIEVLNGAGESLLHIPGVVVEPLSSFEALLIPQHGFAHDEVRVLIASGIGNRGLDAVFAQVKGEGMWRLLRHEEKYSHY